MAACNATECHSLAVYRIESAHYGSKRQTPVVSALSPYIYLSAELGKNYSHDELGFVVLGLGIFLHGWHDEQVLVALVLEKADAARFVVVFGVKLDDIAKANGATRSHRSASSVGISLSFARNAASLGSALVVSLPSWKVGE